MTYFLQDVHQLLTITGLILKENSHLFILRKEIITLFTRQSKLLFALLKIIVSASEKLSLRY